MTDFSLESFMIELHRRIGPNIDMIVEAMLAYGVV